MRQDRVAGTGNPIDQLPEVFPRNCQSLAWQSMDTERRLLQTGMLQIYPSEQVMRPAQGHAKSLLLAFSETSWRHLTRGIPAMLPENLNSRQSLGCQWHGCLNSMRPTPSWNARRLVASMTALVANSTLPV